jgi:hypothetical protein
MSDNRCNKERSWLFWLGWMVPVAVIAGIGWTVATKLSEKPQPAPQALVVPAQSSPYTAHGSEGNLQEGPDREQQPLIRRPAEVLEKYQHQRQPEETLQQRWEREEQLRLLRQQTEAMEHLRQQQQDQTAMLNNMQRQQQERESRRLAELRRLADEEQNRRALEEPSLPAWATKPFGMRKVGEPSR